MRGDDKSSAGPRRTISTDDYMQAGHARRTDDAMPVTLALKIFGETGAVGQRKYSVDAGPAQISVNGKYALAKLRQSNGKIGGDGAFAFSLERRC